MKHVSAGEPIDADTHQRASTSSPASGDRRVIRSEELMCGNREIIILHNDQRYRLVLTRNGKLILQK
jgi:hemin uptake protein HemP